MNKKFISFIIIMVFFTFISYAQNTGKYNGENPKEENVTLTTISITNSTTYSPSVKGVIFEDDFSTETGWTGYGWWSWARGPAVAGGSYIRYLQNSVY